MATVDDELRRLSREFVADIERIVRGPVGCMQSEEDVAATTRDVIRAAMSGFGIAADDIALELAEKLDVMPEPWKP
ncbi:MAG TPA: hypothetical protein VHW66_09380 [Stellaceae bacterium]|jgi:hypothetical protein|nr:hypothetical protein [Stellaceae bacterium]